MTLPRTPPPRRPMQLSPRTVVRVGREIPRFAGARGVGLGQRAGVVALQPNDWPTITRQSYYGKITGRSSIGPNRWEYTYSEVLKTSLGGVGWTTFTGGREGKCYNFVEVPNDGEGEEGNGVNVDDLPTGFSLGPIGIGRIVLLDIVRTTLGDLEAWFSADNPVVGRCPPP